MGKFDGVLLVSDFDNTMLQTLKGGRYDESTLVIHPHNIDRIQYFMAEGGRFSVVSGRVWARFSTILRLVPMCNMPYGTGNGAAIVDPKTGEALFTHTVPNSIFEVMAELSGELEGVDCEISRADNCIDIINPTIALRKGIENNPRIHIIDSFCETEGPILKVLFLGDGQSLEKIRKRILTHPDAGEYDVFYSSSTMMELVGKGADKGSLVKKLAEIAGVSMEHTYCIGDQANDIPMLKLAKRAFAPSNAAPELHEFAHILCHCNDGAVGQAIDYLDTIY